MDCSPPGSSVHGISQTSILEWVVIFSITMTEECYRLWLSSKGTMVNLSWKRLKSCMKQADWAVREKYKKRNFRQADHCVKGQCLDLCWGAGVPRLETKLEAQSWKPLKSSGPSVNILKLLLGSVGSTLKRTKKERTLVQKPFTNNPCPGEWVFSTTAEGLHFCPRLTKEVSYFTSLGSASSAVSWGYSFFPAYLIWQQKRELEILRGGKDGKAPGEL